MRKRYGKVKNYCVFRHRTPKNGWGFLKCKAIKLSRHRSDLSIALMSFQEKAQSFSSIDSVFFSVEYVQCTLASLILAFARISVLRVRHCLSFTILWSQPINYTHYSHFTSPHTHTHERSNTQTHYQVNSLEV